MWWTVYILILYSLLNIVPRNIKTDREQISNFVFKCIETFKLLKKIHGDECTRIFDTNGIPENSPRGIKRNWQRGASHRISWELYEWPRQKEDRNEICYLQPLYLKKTVKKARNRRNVQHFRVPVTETGARQYRCVQFARDFKTLLIAEEVFYGAVLATVPLERSRFYVARGLYLTYKIVYFFRVSFPTINVQFFIRIFLCESRGRTL